MLHFHLPRTISFFPLYHSVYSCDESVIIDLAAPRCFIPSTPVRVQELIYLDLFIHSSITGRLHDYDP